MESRFQADKINRLLIMNKKILYAPLLFLLMISLSSCSEFDEEDPANGNNVRTVAVETITIVEDAFEDYIRLSGTVEAIEDAVISAETSGRILHIVERGAQLSEGDILARLDDRVITAQYNSARTSYQLAEQTYERFERLHADSIISTQDFQNAQAQRDQARAQLDQAEKQLRDVNIEAPFNGRVEERLVQRGELTSPGQPIARIVDASTVRFLTGIPERYANEIGVDSPVMATIRSLPGVKVDSKISYISNIIDPDTRTFTAEIEVNNRDYTIKPEMIVDLRVRRKTIENAIIIPRTSVLRDEDGVNIFVASEENGHKVARIKKIETGHASGALIEIVSGLNDGDEVIVSGMRNLSDGDRLNILTTQSSMERANRLQQADRPFVTY